MKTPTQQGKKEEVLLYVQEVEFCSAVSEKSMPLFCTTRTAIIYLYVYCGSYRNEVEQTLLFTARTLFQVQKKKKWIHLTSVKHLIHRMRVITSH